MIAALVRGSLARPLLVLTAAAGLLIWGALEALRMPIDVFPDLTAPTVVVVTEAHGMAPEEVELLVTRPLEAALIGASGVRRVRSSTAVGSSVISVDFDWGTDVYRARQIVAEKLQLARASLPEDIDPPTLAPISSIMGEILFIAMTSDAHTPMELRSAAEWTVRRRLLAEPGVAQIIPIGGETRQYQIVARPERLAVFGLTVDDLVEAASQASGAASAGFIERSGQEYLVRGLARARSADDLGATVVALREGAPIRIRDVSDVRIGPAIRRGTASRNGEAAVIIGVQKQPGANTLELTRRLDAALQELATELPDGMTLDGSVLRQSDFIRVSVDTLVHALRDGAILVVGVVFLFLLSGRATIVSLLAVPLSLVVAILALRATGASINTMTLGGLAIALGAIVDDAIIVVENAARRLRENAGLAEGARKSVRNVVFEATREIQASIVFATIIIVLVFLPLFALPGVEGRLLQPLGFAYVTALGASLLVALTVTPALAVLMLPRAGIVTAHRETVAYRVMKQAYLPFLDATVRRWPLVVGVAVAGLALALIVLLRAERGFLPEFNEGALTVSAVTMPGASLEQSDEIAAFAEQIIRDHPGVAGVARRTGRAERDEHAQGVNASELDVTLAPGAEMEEVTAGLRERLAAVPGVNFVFGQPISHRIDHMLSGARSAIAVRILGPDLDELRRLAGEVEAAMRDIPGLVDLQVDRQSDVPLLSIAFDRDQLALLGWTPAEAAEALETAVAGHPVGVVREGEAVFDVVVRYPQSTMDALDALPETLLLSPSGARVPLRAVAEIRRDRGPERVSRLDSERLIQVLANAQGRDLSAIADDIERAIDERVAFPDGYRPEVGGRLESARQSTAILSVLSIFVVAGILGVLAIAFGSMRDALIVMINLPLALVGGVIGLQLAGGVLSVAAIIGFIALFGIAARNGVMLVSHIRRLIATGEETDIDAAVRRGAAERLIPILMTALATGLGLAPIALALGQPGGEIQAPLALVVLFGLISSTILNMIVVPAVYRRFGDAARMATTEEFAPQAA